MGPSGGQPGGQGRGLRHSPIRAPSPADCGPPLWRALGGDLGRGGGGDAFQPGQTGACPPESADGSGPASGDPGWARGTGRAEPCGPGLRGCSSFLLGLWTNHLAQRRASSVSGPGGVGAGRAPPRPTAHQGPGPSPPGVGRRPHPLSCQEAAGRGVVGEADPTVPSPDEVLSSVPAPRLHFHSTILGTFGGWLPVLAVDRRARSSPLLHSKVGTALTRGQDKEGCRWSSGGGGGLPEMASPPLRLAQCPVISVL